MIPCILAQRQHKTNVAMPFNDLVSYIEENKNQEKQVSLSNKFSDILDYTIATTDKVSNQEKCIAIRTHGIGDITTASIEMNAVAARNTRCKDPAYHFILSWPEHERPDQEAIFDAAEHAIKALGLTEHQSVIAIHGNTDNIHCHIAVSRINPNNFRSRNIEWAKKTLHMAARQSEIKHGWSHDNGIYIVEIDGRGEKRIILNVNHVDGLAKSPLHAHHNLTSDEILPTWHDPDSLDSWLKTTVAKRLKNALADLQGWHGLHVWLSRYDITLSDSGGGGIRLHAASAETGEVFEVALSKGLRILKRSELEKRWGQFSNITAVPCIVSDLSHLTPRQVANEVENFLAKTLDGERPPEHIIRAEQHRRSDARKNNGELHELPSDGPDSAIHNSSVSLPGDLRYLNGVTQIGQDTHMRRPVTADVSSRSDRSINRDDSKRAERKAQRAAARADLRQRFSQYKRLVSDGDTEHFKRVKQAQAERRQEQKQIREQSKAANAAIPKETTLSVHLLTLYEIRVESHLRKLQAESNFQEKCRSLRATRMPPLSWRAWLFGQSTLGDQAALSALRGIVYQAQRDAKGNNSIDADERVPNDGNETDREQQFRKIMLRLLEEEKKETAIRSANRYTMRPYEADALLARYIGIDWRVTGNGNVKYSDQGGNHLFTDRGNRITFDRVHVSDEEIRLALVHAKQKFGNQLSLTGDDSAFTARMARLADEMGMTILNPELQSTIAAYQAARVIKISDAVTQEQAGTKFQKVAVPEVRVRAHIPDIVLVASQRPSIVESSPAKKEAKANSKGKIETLKVLDTRAMKMPEVGLQQTEFSPDVASHSLTAAEWIATQPKPAMNPTQSGDVTVEYIVIYVAPDGIVVDQGRSVALYQAQTNLVLQIGEAVVVNSNGELCLSDVPAQGDGKNVTER